MKTRRNNLSRRDFLKVTGIMAGSVLLSACSEALQPPSPTPTLPPTSTSTDTPTPTPTSTPTPTQTITPSPTPIPKPFEVVFWADGARQEMAFPHVFSDELGAEVINFKDWRALPELKNIAYLPDYHDALLKAVRSDGKPWITPFPADVETPRWYLPYPEDLNTQQGLTIYYSRDIENQRRPIFLVGAFRLHQPLTDPNGDYWFGGITILPAHPTNPAELRPVTGLFHIENFKKWKGLNDGFIYPYPRLDGAPDDIMTYAETVGQNVGIDMAFYLFQVGAFDPLAYKRNISAWDTDNFPPQYFHGKPFIADVAALNR